MGLETGETQTDQPAENRQTGKIQGFWAKLVASGLRRKLIIPYMLLTLLLAVLAPMWSHGWSQHRSRNALPTGSKKPARYRSIPSPGANASIWKFSLDGLHQRRARSGRCQRDAELSGLLYPLLVNTQLDIFSALDANGQEFFSLGFNPAANRYIQSTGQDFSSFAPVQKILGKTLTRLAINLSACVKPALGRRSSLPPRFQMRRNLPVVC